VFVIPGRGNAANPESIAPHTLFNDRFRVRLFDAPRNDE